MGQLQPQLRALYHVGSDDDNALTTRHKRAANDEKRINTRPYTIWLPSVSAVLSGVEIMSI